MSNGSSKGRPTGSTNVKTIQSVHPAACPHCGKTDREPYRLASVIAHGGVTATGREYSHVVNRRTKCRACGQARIDRYFENRAPEASPGDECEPE